MLRNQLVEYVKATFVNISCKYSQFSLIETSFSVFVIVLDLKYLRSTKLKICSYVWFIQALNAKIINQIQGNKS